MKRPSLAATLDPLRSKWAALDLRSQRVVLAGTATGVALLLIFGLWVPLERSRNAAANRLPALEAARASMLLQAEDVKRLRAQPPTQSGGKQTDLASLRNSFAGAEVTSLGAGRYRVLINEGRFGNWLASLRALNGALLVGELNVTRLPGPGDRVRIEAVLQPPGGAPKSGSNP